MAGMSSGELQALCFPDSFALTSDSFAMDTKTSTSPTIVTEDETESTSNEQKTFASTSSGLHTTLSVEELQEVSKEANAKVSKEILARQGRTNQRWAVDPESGRFLRLVAGCVPILSDGRILLIGSSKENAWLFPKGGWELDETLEEGAIRECFEEAGVLGTLGPRFDSCCLETNKARKRRLELEEKLLRQKPEIPASDASELYSGWSVLSQLSEEDHSIDFTCSNSEGDAARTNSSHSRAPLSPINSVSHSAQDNMPVRTAVKVTFQLSDSISEKEPPVYCDLNQLIPAVGGDINKSYATSDETGSTKPSLTHTHTCMSLFPLYVKHIHDSWPESARLRKAFDIDGRSLLPFCSLLHLFKLFLNVFPLRILSTEAIQVVRPEFRALLMQVKAKGLHLVKGH
jgi:diphosphoinositol-polyphosphate diphosphatase